MPAEPLRLLDPEVLIPSFVSVADLSFWKRMMDWGIEKSPRVGPSSMEALQKLAASPPTVEGLATGDFWTIISRFMSRGMQPAIEPRDICADHLEQDYVPHLGDPGNVHRLIEDLRATGPEGQVALSTSEACWTPATRDCSVCAAARIHRLSGPNGAPGQLSEVWQASFLEKHGGDFSSLKTFASHMFPRIKFSVVAWDHLNTLVGSSHEVVPRLVSHLRVLGQDGPNIWHEYSTTELRQAALSSLGITASPESPQTHKNKAAMNARDFEFMDGKHRCEWHTKLRPDANRIYFAIEGDVVRVGDIIDHLPT